VAELGRDELLVVLLVDLDALPHEEADGVIGGPRDEAQQEDARVETGLLEGVRHAAHACAQDLQGQEDR